MLDHPQILTELRHFTLNTSWPISISQWKNILTTNCLAFAFGLDYPDPDHTRFYGRLYSISHPEASFETQEHIPVDTVSAYFLDTCYILGLAGRSILTPDEAKADEYVFALWGLYDSIDSYHSTFSQTFYSHDFHIIRRNLDGIWVQKEGWKNWPSIVEWKCLSIFYPERPRYFAVKQKH